MPEDETPRSPDGSVVYPGITTSMWRHFRIKLLLKDARVITTPEPLLHGLGFLSGSFVSYLARNGEPYGDPYEILDPDVIEASELTMTEPWTYSSTRPIPEQTCTNNMRAGFLNLDFNYTCDNIHMNGFEDDELARLKEQMKPFTVEETWFPPEGSERLGKPHPRINPPVYYWYKNHSIVYFDQKFIREVQDEYQEDDDRYYWNKTFSYYTEAPPGYTWPDDKDKISFCGFRGNTMAPGWPLPIVEGTSWVWGLRREIDDDNIYDLWPFVMVDIYPADPYTDSTLTADIPDGPWNDFDCNDTATNSWPGDDRPCFKMARSDLPDVHFDDDGEDRASNVEKNSNDDYFSSTDREEL